MNSVCSSAGAAAAAAAGSGGGGRSGGGNAPLLFQQLGQLGGFDNGQSGQVVNQFGQISHFELRCVLELLSDREVALRRLALFGGRIVLCGVSREDTGQLGARSLKDPGDTGRRGLDHAQELATQLVERRQGRERLDTFDVEVLGAERAADNLELVVALGISRRPPWRPRPGPSSRRPRSAP